MCTPKDVLDPSVDGQISYLCGRHDCSLLHFGDPVIGTVYDDRILVSSGQWWPLPRATAPEDRRLLPACGRCICSQGVQASRLLQERAGSPRSQEPYTGVGLVKQTFNAMPASRIGRRGAAS